MLTPQDTVVDAGSTFLWDCTATGTPTPVFTWAKDGVRLQSDTPEHISILSNNSLVIAGVKPEDAGQYQCHARNGVGAHVVQATLTVRGETLVLVPSLLRFYIKKKISIHLSQLGQNELRQRLCFLSL